MLHTRGVASGRSSAWVALEHGPSLPVKLWLLSVEFTPTNRTTPSPKNKGPQFCLTEPGGHRAEGPFPVGSHGLVGAEVKQTGKGLHVARRLVGRSPPQAACKTTSRLCATC